jgi:hypothetical protein
VLLARILIHKLPRGVLLGNWALKGKSTAVVL